MNGSNETPAAAALHTGGCVCGALRYKTIGQPAVATICHCRFCQKRLASAFAVLATFPSESVEFTQGEPIECEHRSDESGRWLEMQFCARCGTTVAHTAQLRPGMTTIAATTFDELGGSTSIATSGSNRNCRGSTFRRAWPCSRRARPAPQAAK